MKISKIYQGDCLEVLRTLPDNSVDSVVTDPPYGLSFMGKHWDYDVPTEEVWKECLRVLKPGGHLLSFAGTRTQHRMAVRIEDAGFEIRDMIAWVYGVGFPKSLNISKAIDKRGGNASLTKTIGEALKKARESRGISKTQADQMFCNGSTNYSWFEGRTAGQRPPTPKDFEKICTEWPELKSLAEMVAEAEREVVGKKKMLAIPVSDQLPGWGVSKEVNITAPSTNQAKQWEGWGTALKPALEPITVARKPIQGTVAENCLKWGVGGINIDGCRVEAEPELSKNWDRKAKAGFGNGLLQGGLQIEGFKGNTPTGRFPANLIHDGSDEVVELFPNESQRFFYCAKASKKERNLGCEELEEKTAGECTDRKDGSAGLNSPRAGAGRTSGSKNNHPTVKPIALMEYLVKLVSRDGATVLDPFAGSGTTGIACKNLNRQFIGIEREEEYVKIARSRIENTKLPPQPLL